MDEGLDFVAFGLGEGFLAAELEVEGVDVKAAEEFGLDLEAAEVFCFGDAGDACLFDEVVGGGEPSERAFALEDDLLDGVAVGDGGLLSFLAALAELCFGGAVAEGLLELEADEVVDEISFGGVGEGIGAGSVEAAEPGLEAEVEAGEACVVGDELADAGVVDGEDGLLELGSCANGGGEDVDKAELDGGVDGAICGEDQGL